MSYPVSLAFRLRERPPTVPILLPPSTVAATPFGSASLGEGHVSHEPVLSGRVGRRASCPARASSLPPLVRGFVLDDEAPDGFWVGGGPAHRILSRENTGHDGVGALHEAIAPIPMTAAARLAAFAGRLRGEHASGAARREGPSA